MFFLACCFALRECFFSKQLFFERSVFFVQTSFPLPPGSCDCHGQPGGAHRHVQMKPFPDTLQTDRLLLCSLAFFFFSFFLFLFLFKWAFCITPLCRDCRTAHTRVIYSLSCPDCRSVSSTTNHFFLLFSISLSGNQPWSHSSWKAPSLWFFWGVLLYLPSAVKTCILSVEQCAHCSHPKLCLQYKFQLN